MASALYNPLSILYQLLSSLLSTYVQHMSMDVSLVHNVGELELIFRCDEHKSPRNTALQGFTGTLFQMGASSRQRVPCCKTLKIEVVDHISLKWCFIYLTPLNRQREYQPKANILWLWCFIGALVSISAYVPSANRWCTRQIDSG